MRIICGNPECKGTTFHVQNPPEETKIGARQVWLLCANCGCGWMIKAGLLPEVNEDNELPFNKRL